MQTYGMALDLRDDPLLIARYKKEHAEVWPEVVARLRDIGVTEMKIFLLGPRMFMYCETRDGFDPANDFARSNDDPTYKKWDELMRTMQQRVDEARPGEWWAQMEPVFDLSAVHVRAASSSPVRPRASAPASRRRSPAPGGPSWPSIATRRRSSRPRNASGATSSRLRATSRTAPRTTQP